MTPHDLAIAPTAPRQHLPGAAGLLVAGALSIVLWGGIAGVAILFV